MDEEYPIILDYKKKYHRNNTWFKTVAFATKPILNKIKYQKPKRKPVYRCFRTQIYPTQKQRIRIDLMIEACRLAYNEALAHQRSLQTPNMNYFSLKTDMKNIISEELKSKIKESKVPVHTIELMYKRVIDAYAAAFTNLRTKNIKHFKLRPIRYTKPQQTINLEPSAFSSKVNGFQVRSLGEMKSSKKFLGKATHEVKLIRDGKGRYFLDIPHDRVIRKITGRKEECALDPGVCTFMTLYDKTNCMKLGDGVADRISKIKKRIDKVNHRRNDPKIKRYQKRLYDKIKNLVNELHWKVANYLVKQYDIINIGKLNSKSCISKNGKLTKSVKDPLQFLSHFKFRTRLQEKAEQYSCIVKVVPENYTSKACGGCFVKNEKLGGSRTFKCNHCEYTWDRDFNGARNIMIKSHGKFKPVNAK